jgi:hypothetical protein
MGKNSSKFENKNNENIDQSGGDHHLNPIIRPKAFFKEGVLTNDGIIENLIREELGFRTQSWAPKNRILLIQQKLPQHYTRLVSDGIIPRPVISQQPILAVSPRRRAVSPHLRAVSPHLRAVSPHLRAVSPQLRAVSPLQPRHRRTTILSSQQPQIRRAVSSLQPQIIRAVSSLQPRHRRIQQRVVSSLTQYKKCNRCGNIVAANIRSCTNPSCQAVFIN